ncbi:cellulase [Marilutibacter chinensis]|uniref:Cellulase n=1 Tax=Marilutibacter chinensis TaxID=2912247 RepID=A0ABS9HRP0_9GAMM|nr:cellulase [Lysobacter chinensis]
MLSLRLAFAIIVFLLAPVAAAKDDVTAYHWRNVAIGGGGFVSGLVFHPRERGLLYARTDIGGAYRWMPAERRWQPLMDWMGYEDSGRFGVESLALDPSDPDRLYLAVGTYLHERGQNGVILRSTDRGVTFRRTGLPFRFGGNEQGRGNGERLAVDPNDGRVLLFGTRADGLWRSDDAGATWHEVPGFPAIAKSSAAAAIGWRDPRPVGVAFVVFDPASGSTGSPSKTIYAGVSTKETSLYRSHDGGASWHPVPRQPVGLRPSHMVRDGRGRWLLSYGDEPGPNNMSDGAVWRFDPADGTWENITPVPRPAAGAGFGWGAVAVDATDPDVIVATTFRRYQPHDDLYRSTDGGRTWIATLPRSDFDHASAPWTEDATPHWMADVEIDPHDPDRIWFVTGYGVWVSDNARAFDAGATMQWRFEQAGFEETVPLALVSPPDGAHLVSGLGDIDGFVHDDLDVSQQRFAGARFSNTESLAFAGRAPRLMVRTGHFHDRPQGATRGAWSEDGGRTWKAFATEPPDGEGAGQITLAADGERAIWRPRNGEHHWITADMGGHWQQVEGLPKTAVVEADRIDEGIYYGFDAATGKLYVSGNGGVAFREVDAAVGEVGDWHRAEIRPHPWKTGEAWIAASWRGLLHWSPGRLERVPGVDNVMSVGLGKPAKDGDAPVLFVFGEVRGQRGLYRSDDGGRRWQRIDDDARRFGGVVRHVTGDPRLHGRVYFGTEGRGIWYGDPQ